MRLSVAGYNFIRGLTGGNGVISKSMVAETLEADEFTFNLMASKDFVPLADVNDLDLYDDDDLQLYAASPDVLEIDESDFERGQPVDLFDDNDVLVLRLYVNKIERISKNAYKLFCLSAVGLLIYIQHNGGMYESGDSVTLEDVLNDILQGTESGGVYTSAYGFTYTIAPDVASQSVVGHLPIASCRDNLLGLLFPYGASIIKALDGSLSFEFSLAQSVLASSARKVYVGAVVSHADNVTDVTVREHEFIADNTLDPVVLADFSNETVTLRTVIFNGPHHTLSTTNSLTIVESNCNYAVVSGSGVLTGMPYVHITTDHTMSTGLTGTKKEAAVKDMTLVNALNGSNTLKRLVNYYANEQTITCDLKLNWYNDSLDGQTHIKAGDFITIPHPYTQEDTLVCVQNLDVTLSAIAKAKATLISNWVPKYLGNNFSNSVLITSNTTFTVPPDVTEMRVVIVGGGQGGHGGENGNNSTTTSGGEGGAAGAGGNSGNVLVVNLSGLTPGATYAITTGTGGNGGAAGTEGDPGTPSTFGSYTSADGAPAPHGVTDFVTGSVYAKPGQDGYKGSSGATYSNYSQGTRGEAFTMPDGTVYQGGAPAASTYFYFGTSPTNLSWDVEMSSGQGGGAAYGANGGAASKAEYAGQDAQHHPIVWGAKGGVGANAQPQNITPGLADGGCGGCGGGGGGMNGTGTVSLYPGVVSTTYPEPYVEPPWSGGEGGSGSSGGKGGDGFVLIYY